MKLKLLTILLFISSYLNADNFLYDQLGNPVFLKLYVNSKSHPTLIEYPILVDHKGSFYAVMIKFDHWICPFCGTLNPKNQDTCFSKNCPLDPDNE